MKKKVFKVSFIPKDENTETSLTIPKPAKAYYPQWLKDIPNNWTTEQGFERVTATQCIPFTDSFTTGYIQELICDIKIEYVNKENDKDLIAYQWSGSTRPMSTRQELEGAPNFFPQFDGYYNAEFSWNTFWEPQTPPGYSTLYHHPSNRFDLPFYTMSGIIDTDVWPIAGPLPFLIKKGFQGIIPAGTPIYQMTFIKRDKWVSDKGKYDKNFMNSKIHQVRRFFSGGYKRQFWERKDYS